MIRKRGNVDAIGASKRNPTFSEPGGSLVDVDMIRLVVFGSSLAKQIVLGLLVFLVHRLLNV